MKLDRPIFLTGCCKSGTTMLGMIFLHHAETGPKRENTTQFSSASRGTTALLQDQKFDVVAHEMEQKDLWDSFFPINKLPLRIGKELALFENPLTAEQQSDLVQQLGEGLESGQRLFSKNPANCFRAHVIREMFPDAKIVAIHRDGRDVIASWGRKGNRWSQFGGYERAIQIFARKWNESIDHIEQYREELGIHVSQYESVVRDTVKQLAQLFEFCELSNDQELAGRIALRNETGLWKSRIPEEYHDLVNELTSRNRDRLGYAE